MCLPGVGIGIQFMQQPSTIEHCYSAGSLDNYLPVSPVTAVGNPVKVIWKKPTLGFVCLHSVGQTEAAHGQCKNFCSKLILSWGGGHFFFIFFFCLVIWQVIWCTSCRKALFQSQFEFPLIQPPFKIFWYGSTFMTMGLHCGLHMWPSQIETPLAPLCSQQLCSYPPTSSRTLSLSVPGFSL